MTSCLRDPIMPDDYEQIAKDMLPKELYDYIAGGAGREISVANNRSQFDRYLIRPNVLSGIDNVCTCFTIDGHKYSLPVMVAPMGIAKICHPNAENEVLLACQSKNVNYISSTMSSTALEDMLPSRENHWFQLYVMSDHGLTMELLHRAEVAGCSAIVITVDAPVIAARYKDIRNELFLPKHIYQANLLGVREDKSNNMLKDDLFMKALSWDHIRTIVAASKLPVYLKGLFCSESSMTACDIGVRGIIVSNHGGRQLDGTISLLECLRELSKVKRQLKLGIDGGIRSGRDIFIALSMGADFTLIGRPIYWALAANGSSAIMNYFNMITQQLHEVMLLAGVQNLKDLSSFADRISEGV